MKKSIAITLISAFLSILALPVQAAMVGTEQLIKEQSCRQSVQN